MEVGRPTTTGRGTKMTDLLVLALAFLLAWLLWMLSRVLSTQVGQTKTFGAVNGGIFWLLVGWWALRNFKAGFHRHGLKVRRER